MVLAGCLKNKTKIKLTDKNLDKAIKSFYLRRIKRTLLQILIHYLDFLCKMMKNNIVKFK